MITRGRVLLVGMLLVAVAWAGVPAPASAHNVLRSTSPADGAEVEQTPAQIVLTFDEPAIAMGTQLVVTGPNGPVQTGNPRLVDNTVTQPVAPGSPPGRYTVAWRVTSADGHPITGEFGFTAKSAGTASPSASPSAPIDAPAPVSPQSGPPGFVWVGIVVIIVAIGLLGWWVVRRRRSGPDPDV